MLLVYPVGIPCLYFVLVWRSRHKLDPDALFVASDVACGGRLTDDSVPVTVEMRQLAKSVILIHGAAADVEQKAVERHTEDLDKQNTARARLTSEDSQRAIEHRAGRKTRAARRSFATAAGRSRDRDARPALRSGQVGRLPARRSRGRHSSESVCRGGRGGVSSPVSWC